MTASPSKAAPANDARKRLIRRIHAEARSRGLDDDARRSLQRRATGKESCADMTVAELRSVVAHIRLAIYQTDWRQWPLFEPHHYLKLPRMIAAFNYVGVVDGELVTHVAVSTRPGLREARACRLVVMPEWQGAGVGLRFLNAVCERWRRGRNPYDRPIPVLFHTSHPGLAAALHRQPDWC